MQLASLWPVSFYVVFLDGGNMKIKIKKEPKPNNQKNLPSDKRRDGWKLKIEKVRQFKNADL
jgi:hypothetical protein